MRARERDLKKEQNISKGICKRVYQFVGHFNSAIMHIVMPLFSSSEDLLI